MYKLSKSSLFRLKQDQEEQFANHLESSKVRKSALMLDEAEELIRLAVTSQNLPTNKRSLQRMISQKIHEDTGYSAIRNFLKWELSYSYK